MRSINIFGLFIYLFNFEYKVALLREILDPNVKKLTIIQKEITEANAHL